MIVSTWQFLQKQVRGGSIGRVAKGVKLATVAKNFFPNPRGAGREECLSFLDRKNSDV